MTTRTRLATFVSLVVLGTAVGCSGDSGRAPVSGKVTLDGQPVERGRIEFLAEPSNPGPSAGAAIDNGTYNVPAEGGAVVGKNRVKIYAHRKTGKRIQTFDGRGFDETVEASPAKYNEKSELVRDIKAGSNQLDFDLQSK